MKITNYLYFLLIILHFQTSFSQDWSEFNPGFANASYIDINFPSSSVGYISGHSGIIIKTVDSGNSWSQLSIGDTSSIESIEFTDINTGYATGVNKILNTTDGGITWNETSLTGSFYNIDFPTANIGYVCGASGKIYKYDNGNWTALTSGTSRVLYDLYFKDENIGFIFGGFFDTSCIIKKTVDGGNTWNSISTPNSNAINGVSFPTPNIGYAVGWDGNIIKTIDGGDTWSALTSGTNEVLYKVDFIDENIGYVAGNNGTILKTIDGGTNWTLEDITFTSDIMAIKFTDLNHGFAVGSDENILKFESTASVNENLINNSQIYPNPFNDKILLNNNEDFNNIIIYDITGKIVINQNILNNIIITQQLTKGTYIVKLIGNNKTVIKKIIKL